MEEIVSWMNNNNGFVMGLLTLVYVIATILICVFNYKSATAARKQTEVQIKQFNATNRPNIIPCFTMVEGAMFCLTFKNIGTECAKNLKITINQEWLDCFDEALKQKEMPGNMRESLKNEFFLSPNDDIKFVLMIPGDGTSMYQALSKEKIKIHLSYNRNNLLETFYDDFELDLLTMAGLILDKSDYIRKMEKQEKALKDISKNIKSVEKAISKEKNLWK